jgi:competence protein ComEC
VARTGAAVALVLEPEAFHEDCARAKIVITPLFAPGSCAAPIVLDRARLARTGAVTLRFDGDVVRWRKARAPDENRPWSRPPKPRDGGKPATDEDETPLAD